MHFLTDCRVEPILDGAIYDRDEGGVIEADQVQWLTAGRGIIHGET